MNKPLGALKIASTLALVSGVILFGFALFLFTKSQLPSTLIVGVLVIAIVQIYTAVLCFKGSRGGWSFALSLNATLSLCLLFGAPKIRDAANISLVISLLPFLAFTAIACLYGFFVPEENL